MDLGHNPAVVVAHPDDEVLFAAGVILRHPDLFWTIICCSIPRRDPIRAWKFFDACNELGALPRLLPSIETEPNENLSGLGNIDISPYSVIVTHNEFGEYGHFHHMQVNAFVRDRARCPVITFGYRKEGLGSEKITLTAEEYTRRESALHCYNHVLPYEGMEIPKFRALEHRYYEVEGISSTSYTYDVSAHTGF